MKHNLSLSSLILLLGTLMILSSCHKDQQQISLRLHGLDDTMSGRTVYLYNEIDPKNPIDSIIIKDTLAMLPLENLQKGLLYRIASEGTSLNVQFVYEQSSLDYILEDGWVKGSPANDACRLFEQDLMALLMADTLDKTTGQERIRQYLATQKENPLVLRAMQYAPYLFDDLSQFEKDLEAMGDNVKQLPGYDKTLTLIKGMNATKPGKAFADFEGLTPQGERVKLSDYLGQGQYALVDFWASWCGPCRQEVPTLIKMHEMYKNKGLLVLGVGVWEENQEVHLKAIEELKIPYPQIYDDQTDRATTLYGIMGIPQIMLIGPDGVIRYRDLRGEQIEQIIKEIYS